jgi:ribonuclease G
MSSYIVINSTARENRLALLENDTIVELHIERAGDRTVVGNIYQGKVVRVLPGMQAAFVDIGLDRTAFLYVSDVHLDFYDISEMMQDRDSDGERFGDKIESQENRVPSSPFSTRSTPTARIQDLLKEGQQVLVQVAKEPIGTKGARITSHITLPGRYLVFMPTINHIGVSRRIEDEEERKRLKTLVEDLRPQDKGFIVRTVSDGATENELLEDMKFLTRLWDEIMCKSDKAGAPYMIHKDLSLSERVIRDIYTPEIDKIVVDSAEEHQKINKFVDHFLPDASPVIELYQGKEPIFDHYGIEMSIAEALGRRVWLKSGGYIVIDQMEALTAIDVNTGSFVGKRNLEDTILKTNLESVRELVYQMRLRNIGGLIIIDFIDMERTDDQEKVFTSLKDALRKDKAKSNILKISELGLVEMTHKRTHESLLRALTETCPYCDGRGVIKNSATICSEIYRAIRRDSILLNKNTVMLEVHPDIADILLVEERQRVEEIELQFTLKFIIEANVHYHREQFDIRIAPTEEASDALEDEPE